MGGKSYQDALKTIQTFIELVLGIPGFIPGIDFIINEQGFTFIELVLGIPGFTPTLDLIINRPQFTSIDLVLGISGFTLP